MALTQVAPPYPIFTDTDGSPLDDGYLYIGVINTDPTVLANQIAVYWDSDFTLPAPQPIRTINGYPSRNGTPGQIYCNSQFSITIKNKQDNLVLYSRVGYAINPGAVVGSAVPYNFTGDGSTLAFTLPVAPTTENATNAYVNGAYQNKDTYSLSGAVITFTSPPPNGAAIEIVVTDNAAIGTVNATNVVYTASGSGAVATNVKTVLDETVSVKRFGAVGDGVTDDTAAIQAAIDTNKGEVYFPDGSYLIASSLTVSNPVKVHAAKTATLIPALGLAGGKLFNILTDDVLFCDLVLDATGRTFTPATGNTYLFFSGNGTTKYYNHTFKNIRVNNVSYSDGNPSATNLLVSHAFYINNVDNVTIIDCYAYVLSGAAVFARKSSGLRVLNNRFWDTRWYTINLAFDVKHFDISDNVLINQTTEGVYWGGSINLVSDVGEIKNQHGKISNNYITGKHSYGAVIRLQSALDVEVSNNQITGVTVGASAASSDLTGIRVSTRGVDASNKNDPSQNIRIVGNYLSGPSGISGDARGIYVSNDFWTTNNPSTGIYILNNVIESPSTSLFWSQPIVIHGLSAGVEQVWIENNKLESYCQSGGLGALSIIASGATGTVDYVKIGGNTLTDIGTPAASYQYGIGINAYVDNVINTKPNTIDNYFYGVRTLANSGPTLEKLDDQNYITNTTNELFAVGLSLYGRYLEGSKTYDPPNLAGGAVAYATDITVTGASLGDMVMVSFSLDNAGIIFTGYVRIANSVRVYIENKTAGAVDLGSGTLTARVYR